jgi:hypothetical protein
MPRSTSVLVYPTVEHRRRWPLAAAIIAALAVMLITPRVASAAAATVCHGTPASPGVLSGTYAGNVVVEGACQVNAGPAVVNGDLTLRRGAVVVAAFGRDGSALSVMGSVRVLNGATLILGCTPRSFPCLDDPSPEHPTLSSAGLIRGHLGGIDALGIIVHNGTIGAGVTERGGGGGVTCEPKGIFSLFGSPVYSDYEDSTIDGSLAISGLHSCWLGVARVKISGNARFMRNELADPDAIEIIDNHIGRNLECVGNSMVWDSADISPTGALYPRQPEPNTVGGTRRGQCVLASPATDSSPPGPGPF